MTQTILSPRRGSKPQLDLREFSVTRNAFLPEESPVLLLSDCYYEPWEVIARQLPKLIDSGDIRQAVQELPVLSTDRLQSEAEWRRAYCLLAYMSHAYIWGGEKPDEVSSWCIGPPTNQQYTDITPFRFYRPRSPCRSWQSRHISRCLRY